MATAAITSAPNLLGVKGSWFHSLKAIQTVSIGVPVLAVWKTPIVSIDCFFFHQGFASPMNVNQIKIFSITNAVVNGLDSIMKDQ